MPSFWKTRPAIFDKRDARRDRERHLRDVYAKVAERDQRTCRCCGRQGTYGIGGEKALHRHHIEYRSKGGADTVENLVTLCALCHALEHVARQLHIIGTNANQRLTFEIHEAAVVDVFGTKPLPSHVRIITKERRLA